MGFFKSREEKENETRNQHYLSAIHSATKSRDKLMLEVKRIKENLTSSPANIVDYAIKYIDDVIDGVANSDRDYIFKYSSKYDELCWGMPCYGSGAVDFDYVPIIDDHKFWQEFYQNCGEEYEIQESLIEILVKRGHSEAAKEIFSYLVKKFKESKNIHPSNAFGCMLVMERHRLELQNSDKENVAFAALESILSHENLYDSPEAKGFEWRRYPYSASVRYSKDSSRDLSDIRYKEYYADARSHAMFRALVDIAIKNKKRFAQLIISLINSQKLEIAYLYHLFRLNDLEHELWEIRNFLESSSKLRADLMTLSLLLNDTKYIAGLYLEGNEFLEAALCFENARCYEEALNLLKSIGQEGYKLFNPKGGFIEWKSIEERNCAYKIKIDELEAQVRLRTRKQDSQSENLEEKYAYGEITKEEYEKAKRASSLSKQTAIINCPSCKKEIEPSSGIEFCPYCGRRLTR